jgi:adenosylcobinamide-GDP ribazoletransferase
VAGQTTARDRALSVGGLAWAVAAAGLLAGGAGLAVRGLIAASAGLLAGGLLQSVARRRLGGTTGDVFGAIAELSATAVLVAVALLP